MLRHRSRRAPTPAAPARRDRPIVHAEPTYVGVDEHTDMTSQISYPHHDRVGDTLEVFSAPFRYVWPSELDLMAPDRRHEPARALERVDMRVVHDMSRGRVDPTSRWPMLQAAIAADVALPGSIDYDQVDRPVQCPVPPEGQRPQVRARPPRRPPR
jgi:hypothetical protein